MIFGHPGWLGVGLAACLAALWTWRRYDARQRAALAAFVSAHLSMELTRSISATRRRLKRGLFIAAIVFLFVSLAEPRVGFRWEEVKRRGNDIVFAVDTSRSMLTPDVKPDRLTRAKLAIDDLVGRLDGDAVGLVAFAGTAFLQCPLTLDYGAFRESLAALDTHIIPLGGTDISSAIRAAQSTLHNRAGSDKVLILVTDGEDLEGNALATAKSAFEQDGLKIYTVGVGSANGDLIPLPADQGAGFLKDSEGHFVRSRLDEAGLQALAQATGGSYAPLGVSNQGLDAIYRQALAPLAKRELQSRTERIYIERYQWPLAAGLACLLASLVLGTRRRRQWARSAISAAGVTLAVGAAAALGAVLPAGLAHASSAAAASAYQRGDFTQAQQEYAAEAARDPGQPLLKFDAGTAAYKAGDFPAAEREFRSSLDAAKSGSDQRLSEQQDAFYNLGNTLYRQGQKTEQRDAQKTIETWTGAVKAYDAALQLRSSDADSKYNRDLVTRKLDQLKKQQQSQSQQARQNKNQDGSKSPQSSSGSSSASQQSKDGSGESKQAQSSQAQDGGQSQQGQPRPGQSQTQQSQSQQGEPQQGEPQQGQSQQGQSQQGQSQQGQSQQAQSQEAQSQQRQSQQAGQAQPPPRQGTVTAAGGNPNQTGQKNTAGAQNEGGQRVPGQMSPEEARELLDSVKDEERKAPIAASAGNSEATPRPPQEPAKDW